MKKFPCLVLSLALVVAASLRAQTPAPAGPATAPAVKSQADLDYEAIWTIWKTPTPEGLTRKDKALWELQDKTLRGFSDAARAFAVKYPADPRRRDPLIQSSYTRPWFLTGFKPEFDTAPGEKNLIVDQPALDAWRAAQLTYLAEAIEAPDATERERGGAMYALLIDSRSAAQAKGASLDLAPIGALVDRVIAAMPDARALVVVDQYLQALKAQSPDAAKAFEARLQAVPTLAAAIAEAGVKREAAAAEKAKKIADIGSIKFTAADGREVELARLKGKVVLVDFWATWCGPCKEEIPNVVANYNKYHDKGFEVVGVTLENPGLAPKDTEEQKAAKLAKAKAKMLNFTQANHMPWPQYYDGKWWKNDYAVKFGIELIPAMFLLDQQGNIVSTEARGPKLEAELKRLLKL